MLSLLYIFINILHIIIILNIILKPVKLALWHLRKVSGPLRVPGPEGAQTPCMFPYPHLPLDGYANTCSLVCVHVSVYMLKHM